MDEQEGELQGSLETDAELEYRHFQWGNKAQNKSRPLKVFVVKGFGHPGGGSTIGIKHFAGLGWLFGVEGC